MGAETWLAIGKFVGAVLFGTATSAPIWAVWAARLAVLALASKALVPKLDLSRTAQEKKLTVTDPIYPQAVVYGEDMLSGPMIVANTTGQDNKFLTIAVALTGHEINLIKSYRLDDEDIALTDIDSGTPTGSIDTGKYADVVDVEGYLGTSTQAASPILLADFNIVWTAAHQLRGWSYMVWRYELVKGNEAFATGSPQNVKAVIQGKKVYDPRLDSTNGGVGTHRLADPTTWEWSNNPALCLADFMLDTKFGMQESSDRIDWAMVATAADVCEEQVEIPPGAVFQNRYTCNFTFRSDEKRSDVVDALITAMMGRLVFSQGLWKMWAGEAVTADVDLDEANFGGRWCKCKATAGAKERYNRVRGKYVDPTRDYAAQSYVEQRSSTYEAQDGDEVRILVADFPTCNNEYEAQRNAIITLAQSRQQRVVVFQGNMSCFRIQPGSTVTLSLSEYGFSGEKFFVTDWVMNEQGIALTMVEEIDASWADPAVGDYSVRTKTGEITFANQGVPAPTNLTATATIDGVILEWDNPPGDTFALIEVWRSFDNTRGNATLLATVPGETFIDILIEGYRTVYYWIRSVNASGTVSAWEPNLTTTTASGIPLSPANALTLDPDFDNSSALDPDDFWDKLVFEGGTPGGVSTNAVLVSSGGSNGGPFVAIDVGNPTGLGSTVRIDIFTTRRFRAAGGAYSARIRYRRWDALTVDDEFQIEVRGYVDQTTGSSIGSWGCPVKLANTDNDWTDVFCTFDVEAIGSETAQYFDVRFGQIWTVNPNTGFFLDVDSIFVFPAPQSTALSTLDAAGNRAGGSVPQALAADANKYLKGDGTWGTPTVSGSTVALRWTFDTATAEADPGAGDFRYNNATPASVTEIYISSTSDDAQDLDSVLSSLASGDQVFFQTDDDVAEYLLATITGTVDNTGWWSLEVTIDDSGTLPANTELSTMFIFKNSGGGGGGGTLDNVVEDLTPELGGELDALKENIVNVGDLEVVAPTTDLQVTLKVVDGNWVEWRTAGAAAAAIGTGMYAYDFHVFGVYDSDSTTLSSPPVEADTPTARFHMYAQNDDSLGFFGFNGNSIMQVYNNVRGGKVVMGSTDAGGTVRNQLEFGPDLRITKIGDFSFDTTQSPGAGQDGYVFMYDDGASAITLQSIPIQAPSISIQNGNYTFTLANANNIVAKNAGGAGETYTIPANSVTAFPLGTLIGIDNDGGGDLTIAINTDTLEGTDGLTGSRTLSDNNSATIEKIATTKWRYTSTDGVAAAAIDSNIGIFTDSGSQSITTSPTTLGFDTETADEDTNYALAGGEITATDAGWYMVSVNILLTNPDTLGATRARFDAWLQQDAGTGTWTDVNNIRARSEVRESASATGDGVNMSGFVQLSAGEAIRVRVDQDADTTMSTETGQCTLNIHRIAA